MNFGEIPKYLRIIKELDELKDVFNKRHVNPRITLTDDEHDEKDTTQLNIQEIGKDGNQLSRNQAKNNKEILGERRASQRSRSRAPSVMERA